MIDYADLTDDEVRLAVRIAEGQQDANMLDWFNTSSLDRSPKANWVRWHYYFWLEEVRRARGEYRRRRQRRKTA